MDKKINLPNYKTILPNSIFAKDGEELEHPLLPIKLPTKDVVFLSRYSIPTEKQVCKYIQNSIKSLELMANMRNSSEKEWYDFLSNTIKDFPDGEAMKIAKGDKKSISHLESHCDLDNRLPGRSYLYILNQSVPSPVLDSLVEAYNAKGIFLLGNSLEKITKNRNCFEIQLNKDGSLMNKNEFEHLLSIGVRDSDVFKVECSKGEYSNAVKNLESIYSILNSSENIKNIKDDSSMFLLYQAVETFGNYSLCITKESMLGELSKGLMKKLGLDDSSDEPKKDKGFDFFNHHSDN